MVTTCDVQSRTCVPSNVLLARSEGIILHMATPSARDLRMHESVGLERGEPEERTVGAITWTRDL